MKLRATVILLALAAAAALLPLHAQEAQSLFAQAKAAAQAQHKDILMLFSASWCGPCKRYEQFLEGPQIKPITDRAFVVVRIDVGERAGDTHHADTPGGAQLRTRLGAEGEPGFPFIVITDASGHPLANSYRDGKKSQNIGYPELPEEIAWYASMMKHVPALTPGDIAAMRAWLQQHARHS